MQVFNCPLSAMAMHNVAKTHLAGIPMPDIVAGKKGYYSDLIFAVGKKDGKLQASQQYDHVRRAQRQAGIRKTGVISHLNRHVAAVQARVLYSESIAEVAVAGNWRVDILSGVYAQVGSADSIAHRAGYTNRAAVGNFRQAANTFRLYPDCRHSRGPISWLGRAVGGDARGGCPFLQCLRLCTSHPEKT